MGASLDDDSNGGGCGGGVVVVVTMMMVAVMTRGNSGEARACNFAGESESGTLGCMWGWRRGGLDKAGF